MGFLQQLPPPQVWLSSLHVAVKVALAFLGVPLLGIAIWPIRRDKRLDKIPGPKGSLLTGIGLDLLLNALTKFKEWADEYGEVYKIRLGFYTWVVLSSPEAVKEILDKQSLSTSSKLAPPMSELVVGGMRMEILRLCPVPPWSIRHFTDADVTYKDMVIPKGTAIACNTVALHFDLARFPDPLAFRPERYAEYQRSSLDYSASPDPNDMDHFCFGAGRRICPGIKFTENNLSLILASLVWAFDIKPAVVLVDGKEREIPLNLSEEAFDPYPLGAPKPFKVRFIPRSEERAQIIQETGK
ncbi:cytochrome P450 [Bombardia bombarda]|uniref:Cytochrome P450 n=1 Tax=Bombardia bombarda TaxID=252184 RepID=A0AA39XN13_9PEZI|nr:cytochrome P450 [Bombardia bombarda]